MFIGAAQAITKTRAEEFEKSFSASTILYLDNYLYRELCDETTHIAPILFSDKVNSRMCKNNNPDCRAFDYKPSKPIPLVITVYRKPDKTPIVLRNVTGVTVGVNSQGECNHYENNLTGGVAI